MPARPGTARFTHQRIVMLDDAQDERIVRDADSNGTSISDVLRTYIDLGIEAADELARSYDEETEVHDPDFP